MWEDAAEAWGTAILASTKKVVSSAPNAKARNVFCINVPFFSGRLSFYMKVTSTKTGVHSHKFMGCFAELALLLGMADHLFRLKIYTIYKNISQ
jgi:hypothetical protein